MSNNSVGGNLTDAGAVAFGGHNNAAPAQFQVGAVGFGPLIDDEDGWVQLTEKGRQMAADIMAQTIVRIQRELEEAQAQIAIYEAERTILQRERDNWRAAATQATADRDRNKREWDKCAAELAAVLNGFDQIDAADAEAESMEAAE